MMLIQETLAAQEIGAPITFKNLTVFPMSGEDTTTSDYLTLDQALAAGVVSVTEVSAHGSVPDLHFVNRGDHPVFLMDGEEVIGAKQNRTLNISILASGNSSLKLPVTCVEAGRWSHTSAEFAPASHAHYAAGRAQKHRSVSESLQSDGSRVADQRAVWDDIEAKVARMATPSSTRAMADIYTQHETGVEEFVSAFPAHPGRRGAVFAIGGEIIGMDLFDRASTFTLLIPKIIRSYALDALDTISQPPTCRIERETVVEFLAAVAAAETQSFPALGLGVDLRLQAARLTGGALIAEERLVHLSVFTGGAAPAKPDPETPLSRASVRRRSRNS